MKLIDFRKTELKDGFWKNKTDIVSEVSVYNVYNRFRDTGRFDALDCNWKQGDPNEPHIFWDSDIAKWVESVAFIIEKRPCPDLEKVIDEQASKGYRLHTISTASGGSKGFGGGDRIQATLVFERL